MARIPFVLFMFLALFAACSSNGPGVRSDLLDPDGWNTMLSTGMAVAPVAGSTVVSGSADAAAFFSDELDAALRNALPGTPITSSNEVYARLEDAGDNAQARLRSLRRRLVRDLELDEDELTAISRDIDGRFLLVVLADEGATESLQRTQLDDLQAFSYSMDTHGYPTGELRGQAIGYLIDLESAARVWEAQVSYESENLASRQSDAARVIEDTRSDAVFRLTEALALADR